MSERDVMAYDVAIVGAGPAGLACALRLKQQNEELNVCVLEKGSAVGAHSLAGAVIETEALTELVPNWRDNPPAVCIPVEKDEILWMTEKGATKLPMTPPQMNNHGNFIVSLGSLTAWLGDIAEEAGVEIFPGFPAQSVIYNDDGSVGGIITGDMGLDAEGNEKASFEPGMELKAKYTVFAEGCRGHLGKELIAKFGLDTDASPQHYGLGFKEIWDIDPAKHQEGLVVHTAGWPLDKETTGGGYLYHAENNQVFVGLIVDLNYSNPHLSPFDEFQRYKHHPKISQYLEGGKRVSYGARAMAKGGFNSLPKMTMPGALLVGCDAGTINFAKIKGNHTAMKSGMLAAEAIIDTLITADGVSEEGKQDITLFTDKFKDSWLYEELYNTRNFTDGYDCDFRF